MFTGGAFVEFEDEAILQLNGYELNEQRLRISMHLKQTKDDKKK